MRHLRRCGLSRAYLSRIENGREPPPFEPVIEKLAEELGADKYEFFSSAGRGRREFWEPFRKNPKGMASFLRRAKEVNWESDMAWEALEKPLPRLKGNH